MDSVVGEAEEAGTRRLIAEDTALEGDTGEVTEVGVEEGTHRTKYTSANT